MKGGIGLGMLLCCLAAFEAKAGCTAAGIASPAGYGSISSTLVRTVPQSTSSSNSGLTALRGFLLLSEAYFKATVITPTGPGMADPPEM